MTNERYLVVSVGDGWVVVNNGRVSGLFSSKETAAAFAKLRAEREVEAPADADSFTILFPDAEPALA